MGFKLPSYTIVIPYFKSLAQFIKIDSETIWIFLSAGVFFMFLIGIVIVFVTFKICKSLNCIKHIMCCYCFWNPFKELKKMNTDRSYNKMNDDDDDDDDDDGFLIINKIYIK